MDDELEVAEYSSNVRGNPNADNFGFGNGQGNTPVCKALAFCKSYQVVRMRSLLLIYFLTGPGPNRPPS